MNTLEKKIDALMRYCTAKTAVDAKIVREELWQLMKARQGGRWKQVLRC